MMANVFPISTVYLEQAKTEFTAINVSQSEPMEGPPFSEIFTEDTPTTWDGRMIVTQGQARGILAWYKQSGDDYLAPINGGWFEIPVKTVFGLQTQTVKMIGNMLQLSSFNGRVVTLTMTLLTREVDYGVDISDGSEDADDILELVDISPEGDVEMGAKLVDIAVNVDLNELN